MKTEFLSLLGLARRAGKLEAGFDASVSAARNGTAFLLTAAEDISDKTYKNLRYEGERAGIPAVRAPALSEELGKACGVKAGVLAVTDRGFAKALLSKLERSLQEKEEDAL